MKRLLYISFLVLAFLVGCNSSKYITVKHVKPVNYNRSYNPKKDRRKKRVKYVKVKILKQSATVKPAKQKAAKIKKEREEEQQENSEEKTINESDSTNTGFMP